MLNTIRTYISIIIVIFLLIGCSKNKEQDEQANDLAGQWSGDIQIPHSPLHIDMAFEHDENWTGLISIPVQGISNYPLSSVSVKADNVVFIMDIAGQKITFEGKFEDEKIAGTFRQEGQSFPFELTKSTSITEEEETGEFLSIETAIGTLYGELAVPETEGTHPILIIIPGSGPTDRNGNTIVGKNNSLKFLAEELAEHGIASLRFDKRGAGKNVAAIGKEGGFLFEQYVDDAVQWVDLLKEDERFSDVGVIGHSEGSLVGMLAAQQADVDIFISLAGAGRPIDQVLYDQLKEQLSADLLDQAEQILSQIKHGDIVEDIPGELTELFHPSNQPFLSSWIRYNPSEEIKRLSIPIQIVNGNRDIQVPVSEAELLDGAASNSDFLIVDKMNHVLKESPADRQGNLSTYSDPTLPLATGLIDGIVTFLKENNFAGE